MRVVKLGDVCKIVNGGTPKTSIKEYWDGDVLWITPKDLGKISNSTTEETVRNLTQHGLKNSSAKVIPENSVILSTRAPIGHLVINTKPMSFNQGCKGIVPGELIDVKYLYHFLKHSKQALNELGTGTTFPELSMTALSQFSIPLPPLEEQRRVVARLDAAFEKIDQAIELTQKNLNNTKHLFISSLEKNFIDNGKDKFVRIGDVCTVKGGKRLPKDKKLVSKKTPYPYIRVTDFDQNGGVDQSKMRYLMYDVQKVISNYIITTEDVFLSIAGTIGVTGIVPEALNGANLTENACRLIPDETIYNRYLYYFTLSDSFIKQCRESTKQSAQPKLALTRIKSMQLRVPSLEAQHRTVADLDLLTDKLNRLEKSYLERKKKLYDLKQSMLTQAFSDKVEV